MALGTGQEGLASGVAARARPHTGAGGSMWLQSPMPASILGALQRLPSLCSPLPPKPTFPVHPTSAPSSLLLLWVLPPYLAPVPYIRSLRTAAVAWLALRGEKVQALWNPEKDLIVLVVMGDYTHWCVCVGGRHWGEGRGLRRGCVGIWEGLLWCGRLGVWL